MLNPTDFASADDYVAAVKAEMDNAAHGDDLTKSVDHAALFDLVPRSEATHIAVSDGAWSDPATWYEGRIPDAGAKVLIPEAISVTYDSTSEASLFTVRVDGKVDFATDTDTLMKVDTFVVSTTGKLNIGTEANPVQQGVSAQIVIADNGPIDVTWDPMLLSRGVISHGEVQIHGQEKASHLKVSTDAMQGDTQLVLEAAPEGWQVGDQLVLTGTHYVGWQWDNDAAAMVYKGTEDEEVTVTAIDGNVITLDRPLTYDHDTPRDDLDAYVANYSRNVVIATENADDVPVHQRGHTMFMHSDNIDIRYAEFQELGRTDKSEASFNPALVEDMQSDTNIQSRYAFHLHKTGTDAGDEPAIVIGNAVWGSPGWGFTQHQSNALMEDNAAYNTFGAGFVAETGDEIGAWRNNIAIKADGMAQSVKVGANEFDIARTGDGYWFSGRLVESEGNVAAGVNNGFVYMHRASPLDEDIRVSADNLDQPEILRYGDDGSTNLPPIQHFIDNEVLAAYVGLNIVKAQAAQNHDVRSVFEGFTAWDVMNGVEASYTAHYTWIDLDLVASDDPGANAGITFGKNATDMVVNGATIEGFRYGVNLAKDSTSPLPGGEFGYVLIDVDAKNSQIAPYLNYDPAVDLILTGDDLVAGRLELDLAWDEPPLWVWDTSVEGYRKVSIDGVKTDSIGQVSYTLGIEEHPIGLRQMSGLLSKEGYYTTSDGRKIVIVEEYFADRATGEIQKIGIPIQLADDVPLTQFSEKWLPTAAIYRGEIDLNSAAPVTADDSATTQIGTPVVIDVMANDSDPEGDALILDGLVQPRNGRVEANADGTVTYTPDRNFVGEESFNYWITDDNGSYTRATVQVSVVAEGVAEPDVTDLPVHSDPAPLPEPEPEPEPVAEPEPLPEPEVNEAPVAESDAYATSARSILSVSKSGGVLQNDFDADADALSARVVDGPGNGKLAFSQDGSFVYKPHGNFSGKDSFTYRVSDGQDDSNLATVQITVAEHSGSNGGGRGNNKTLEASSTETLSFAASDTETDLSTFDSNSEPINTLSSTTTDTSFSSEPAEEVSDASSGSLTATKDKAAGGRGSSKAATNEAAVDWHSVTPEQSFAVSDSHFDWHSFSGAVGAQDEAGSAVQELLRLVEELDIDGAEQTDLLMADALSPYAQDFTLV